MAEPSAMSEVLHNSIFCADTDILLF
jgi:hypothetical protein